MTPRIEHILEKKLIGKKIIMSLAQNKTSELWRSFMPRRKEIKTHLTEELISMRVYNTPFVIGNLHQEFEKWATVEVSDFGSVPSEMETFILPSGLYAVFHYKGLNTDDTLFKYIYNSWLPNSNYELDSRPHFDLLGKNYQNNNPESEEDIYIPITLK